MGTGVGRSGVWRVREREGKSTVCVVVVEWYNLEDTAKTWDGWRPQGVYGGN